MLSQLALTLLSLPAANATIAVAPILQDDPDHAEQIRAAGEDIAKLTELAEAWVAAGGKREAARAAWARVVECDSDNETARKGLGHPRYADQWFESYSAYSLYRRDESARMAEQGLARLGDEWVPIADRPFLRMGWTKDGAGRFVSFAVLEQREREAQLVADGWQQQDLTWVHPDDFDKWSAGLWKCGEEWLDIEAADEFHANLQTPWQVLGNHFTTVSTCSRNRNGAPASPVEYIVWWADLTYDDLVRIFGVEPIGKPELVVVNSIPQYNTFASGDPASGRQPAETHGWSSVHYAYFADCLVDTTTMPPRWHGAGTCYWALEDESLKAYGRHAVPHAAAQSYIDAIDPSWESISRALAGGGENMSSDTFWAEKKIPFWLRYGAASYVERFFIEPGQGNPRWARDWAFANLRAAGGPRPLTEIFVLLLDPSDPAGGGKRIAEAGLVVSFILDGECEPVIDAHADFKVALRAGERDAIDDAVEGLQQAILDNEQAFERYIAS